MKRVKAFAVIDRNQVVFWSEKRGAAEEFQKGAKLSEWSVVRCCVKCCRKCEKSSKLREIDDIKTT